MSPKKILPSVLILTTAASAFPVTSLAASTSYDLRKQVIELTGIMHLSDGSQEVSREEFAAMLVKASEYRSIVSDMSSVSVFADVPTTSTYAPFIRIAARQGWMKSYLGGQFKPEEYITLQDAVKAILSLLGYTDTDFTGDQMGSRMAKYSFLELNDQITELTSTEVLTQDNCMNLFYNLLKTKSKDSQTIYGNLFDLTLSTDEELNPLEMLDTSVKGPYVVTKNRTMSSQLPFSMEDASFFLDGEPCTKSNIKDVQTEYGYVVMYYNTTSKTVWVYSEAGSDTSGQKVISGTVSNIYYKSSDVMTPSSVTITMDDGVTSECSLSTTDLQFAFSIYGTVSVGDDVVLICSGTTESSDGTTTYQVTDFVKD